MKEEGSSLLLVLLLILVLLTFAAGITAMISHEIRMVADHENRIQAAYRAESGLEEAVDAIIKNPNVRGDDLLNIAGDNYRITKASRGVEGEIITYNITARGTTAQATEDITIRVQSHSINITTVNSASNIDTEIVINFFGLKIEKSTKIIGGEQENITSLPTFNFERSAYVNEDQSGQVIYHGGIADTTGKLAQYYFADQSSFQTKFTTGFWNVPNWGSLGREVDLPPGEIIYVDGDLNLGSIFGEINGGTATEPAIIVVNGDLTYDSGFTGINDVVFLVKGNFELRQVGLLIDRSFVYTEGAINIGGNFTDYTFAMDCDGIFVSKQDASIKSLWGSVEYEEIDLRQAYRLLSREDQSNLKPKIVYWD